MHPAFEARRVAASCAACRRPLAPEAPVWLRRVDLAGTRWRQAVCADCAAPAWPRVIYDRPRPCDGCGRAVSYPVGNRLWPRRHAHCSERCLVRCRNRRRLAERQQRRQRVCATCGRDFTGAKSHAVYCSPACRQRAYLSRRAVSK